jgi:hypothetical protein
MFNGRGGFKMNGLKLAGRLLEKNTDNAVIF